MARSPVLAKAPGRSSALLFRRLGKDVATVGVRLRDSARFATRRGAVAERYTQTRPERGEARTSVRHKNCSFCFCARRTRVSSNALRRLETVLWELGELALGPKRAARQLALLSCLQACIVAWRGPGRHLKIIKNRCATLLINAPRES